MKGGGWGAGGGSGRLGSLSTHIMTLSSPHSLHTVKLAQGSDRQHYDYVGQRYLYHLCVYNRLPKPKTGRVTKSLNRRCVDRFIFGCEGIIITCVLHHCIMQMYAPSYSSMQQAGSSHSILGTQNPSYYHRRYLKPFENGTTKKIDNLLLFVILNVQ